MPLGIIALMSPTDVILKCGRRLDLLRVEFRIILLLVEFFLGTKKRGP